MKLSLFLLMTAAPSLGFGQSKADYTIAVHESRIGLSCNTTKGISSCKSTQVQTAQVEGKKYELESETFFSKGLVALGDYQGKAG